MKRFFFVCACLLTLTAHADESFFDHWLDNVTKTQDNQPHWMTPLVTITPRLEQEYRFDYLHTHTPNGATQDTYGNFKGLEIIPSENTEIIISGPTYQSLTNAKGINTSGYADELFLLKYRLATANEEHGNYIVSAFLGATIPTGNTRFSNNHTVYTPTIAAGKGWGDREQGFDIQSTLGISLPTGGVPTLGRIMTFNTAFQGYIGKFWPEIETSFTHWYDGPRAGKSQMVITYGATIGRFQIRNRMRVIVGLGYQSVQGTKDITVTDALISTVRLTF